MKKFTILFFGISLIAISCTKEVGVPLPVGCTKTMFYAVDIKPIIDTKCATPGCHEPAGTGNGDFTVFSGVQSKVDNGTIITRVYGAKDMPSAGSPQLTADELSNLKCWLDQGAPNN